MCGMLLLCSSIAHKFPRKIISDVREQLVFNSFMNSHEQSESSEVCGIIKPGQRVKLTGSKCPPTSDDSLFAYSTQCTHACVEFLLSGEKN